VAYSHNSSKVQYTIKSLDCCNVYTTSLPRLSLRHTLNRSELKKLNVIQLKFRKIHGVNLCDDIPVVTEIKRHLNIPYRHGTTIAFSHVRKNLMKDQFDASLEWEAKQLLRLWVPNVSAAHCSGRVFWCLLKRDKRSVAAVWKARGSKNINGYDADRWNDASLPEGRDWKRRNADEVYTTSEKCDAEAGTWKGALQSSFLTGHSPLKTCSQT